MRENIKQFGISFTITYNNLIGFVFFTFVPGLSKIYGFYLTMFFFGGMSLLCGIFIIFYVPETRGKICQIIMFYQERNGISLLGEFSH